ncbi:MAG TPA: peptidylprolyl isomerase [Candidatus Mcinerneyibacteriales bacterium]|nr:peptidylprolyl isomerase [Candidatus Mcinerneyibacteriales bacterium]HPJ70176.1 peptidylprolyl isomerase [Candidatus Mcinerneyibacteriales bacterium]
MKHIIGCLTVLLMTAGSVLAQGEGYSDGIAARINDTVILKSEVKEAMMGNPNQSLEEQRKVLKEMIKNKVLYMEALESEELVVNSDDIEKRLDAMIERIRENLGGEASFKKALKEEGLDENTLRSIYRQQIKEEMYVQNYVATVIRPGISISDDEVKAAYDENSAEFKTPETFTYTIGYLPVAMTAEDERAILMKLADIRKRILDHEMTFEEAASRYSQGPTAPKGGDLGLIGQGMMVPEFEEVVFNLKKGEISRPFKTKFGYHIALCSDIQGEKRAISHIILLPAVSEEKRKAFEKNVKAAFETKGMEGMKEWASLSGVQLIPFEEAKKREINTIILDILNGLKPGQISPVSYINNGLTFIYLDQHQEARQMAFEEVREYVKNYVYGQKIQEEIEKLYAKLQNKYYIEILI